MANLDHEQKSIVRAIVQESLKIKDPVARRKFKRAAVQTGLVESNLRNLSGGDADSAGWRQERASLYANPTNVKASVRRFREEFLQHYDPGERASDVAGQVQRPAAQYLGRYQERAGEAKQILKGFSGGPLAPGGYQTDPQRVSLPGVDNSGVRKAALQEYVLNGKQDPNALLNLGYSLRSAPDQPSSSIKVPGFNQGSPPDAHRDGFGGKVNYASGADRAGVQTHKRITKFLKGVSDRYGAPITVGTGSNHSQYSVSGNVSDHWVGKAADVPAAGHDLVKLGRKALIAAGMPKAQARKVNGGLFNVNGYQIIFNTQEGGDHTDHLHVGYSPNR